MSCPDIGSFSHLAEILHVSVDELLQIKTAPLSEKKNLEKIVHMAFRGVALAMGIAVLALSALGELDTRTGMILLGLGLTSMALYLLREKE